MVSRYCAMRAPLTVKTVTWPFEGKSIRFWLRYRLKMVTFAGAVTFSGAETEDIAQWVNLVGSAPENVTGSL